MSEREREAFESRTRLPNEELINRYMRKIGEGMYFVFKKASKVGKY